jgi:hypothetical protein
MFPINRDPEVAHLSPVADVGIKPYRMLEPKRRPAFPTWDFGIVHAAGAYVQQNTGWCSLATFANCMFYHHGEWVKGPLLERKWHETSPWYLAALSNQPHDEGRFLEETLVNAGLITEADRTWVTPKGLFLPDAFRNQFIEIRYWFTNSRTPSDWDSTWADLQAYVNNVWILFR